MVKIEDSNSIFLSGMKGSKIPIVISHGEGRAQLSENEYTILKNNNQICMSYICEKGNHTEIYPNNLMAHIKV